LARARSPNPRTADQYIFLHLAPQKRCGEPPRRARNGCSHHSHNFEDPSAITEAVIARHMFLLDPKVAVVQQRTQRKPDRHEKEPLLGAGKSFIPDREGIEPRVRANGQKYTANA